MASLEAEVSRFEAGRIQHYAEAWAQITSDPDILGVVSGAKIIFDFDLDCLPRLPVSRTNLSKDEWDVVGKEIENLLSKGVISVCNHVPGEVLSPIFTRGKKDGTQQMILNLKHLNSEVTYHHFQMEILHTALSLIRKHCLMASTDLKDAYYSVPIHPDHRKLLRFVWENKVFEYNALPNGLAVAPRLFTKLLKQIIASLRSAGHISMPFLDHSLLIGNTEMECITNIRNTLKTTTVRLHCASQKVCLSAIQKDSVPGSHH